MKAIRIVFLVMYTVVALGALSSCSSDSTYEDCYKETKKALEKKGIKSVKAAQRAKAICFEKEKERLR